MAQLGRTTIIADEVVVFHYSVFAADSPTLFVEIAISIELIADTTKTAYLAFIFRYQNRAVFAIAPITLSAFRFKWDLMRFSIRTA